MPLGDGDVTRLAGHEARVVQRIESLCELDQPMEILQRPIPAAALEIPHEGRTVYRREHLGRAADPHGVRRIARPLRELRGCAREELTHQAFGYAYARITHLG